MISTLLFTVDWHCASSKHNLYFKKESSIFTNLIVKYEHLPLLYKWTLFHKEKSNLLIKRLCKYHIICKKEIMS